MISNRTNTNRAVAMRRSFALVAATAFALVSVAGLGHAAESKSQLSGVVNLNTANVEELQLLPGVGVKRAVAIIEVRKTKGGFKSVDELTLVKGVGEAMVEKLRPHLALKGKTTAQRL